MQKTLDRLTKIIVTTAFLLVLLFLAALWPAPLPVRADQPITPWLPTFVCPDRITLWDDIEQVVELGSPDFDVLSVPKWTLFFQAADGAEYGSQTGSGPIVFDDRSGLREDVDYSYLLTYVVEAKHKTSGEVSKWQANLIYERHTQPYCTGQIHSDYAFNERHYYFMAFDVWEGYNVTIPAGTTLEQYQSGGEIHLENPDNDILVKGTLISTTLVVGGNNALLSGAHISGGGARVFNGGSVQMIGGTLAQAKFTVYTATVTLDNVTGLLTVEQWPGSNVQVKDSTLQGSLYVKSNAALTLWDSTLTGYVRAGPGGFTSNPISQATLISTTVLAPDGCTNGLVRSEKDAVVTLNRYRIDTRGQSNCSAIETFGGQMRLWRGTINGQIRASGDTNLEVYRSEIQGNGNSLLVFDGGRVNIAASRLDSVRSVYVYPGGQVTITDSSLVSSTIFLQDANSDTRVTLLRNDLSLVMRAYLFWIEGTPGSLVAHDNCFYCPLALTVDSSSMLPLRFEENYWGHALGPNFPPANVNPDGAGITAASDAVLIQPFLDAEPTYCRQWPRSAPHSAQGLVGPAGGTITAPEAVLVFPPGAVAQEAAITWSQGEETAHDVKAATPTATTLLNRFNLAATSVTAPSQPLDFQRPISLTLLYDRAMIGGADEASLTLNRWDGATWLPLAGTVVSVATHSLQTSLPTPGSYGLFGNVERRSVYLPHLCIGSELP